MKKLERLHMISKAEMLKPLRAFVRELAVKLGCDNQALDSMVLAINEACMNVIQHAYHGRENESFVIEFWKDKTQLVIKIIDTADIADIESIKSRALDDVRPGGLGVHFIRQVMDSVEYKNRSDMQGNMLEMRKKLTTSAA